MESSYQDQEPEETTPRHSDDKFICDDCVDEEFTVLMKWWPYYTTGRDGDERRYL